MNLCTDILIKLRLWATVFLFRAFAVLRHHQGMKEGLNWIYLSIPKCYWRTTSNVFWRLVRFEFGISVLVSQMACLPNMVCWSTFCAGFNHGSFFFPNWTCPLSSNSPGLPRSFMTGTTFSKFAVNIQALPGILQGMFPQVKIYGFQSKSKSRRSTKLIFYCLNNERKLCNRCKHPRKFRTNHFGYM